MADIGEKKVATRKKKTYEKRERRELEPEQILKSEKGTEYLVEGRLGAGGFGEVWKVSLLKDPEKRFAMKTEPNFAEKRSMLRLKCEVSLFEEIARASNRVEKKHFVKMYDKGKTVDFKYFVMDLIWMSLGDIRRNICGGAFSPHTKIQIARQVLKALEALHEIGYIHRDIKPANVAVGLPPRDVIIYLIDFGIARPYRDKDGAVKAARSSVRFMGTKKYASMESLAQREQARRDDLEVWMYMMIEMYDEGNLTWCDLDEGQDQSHIDLRMVLMQQARKQYDAGELKVPEKWVEIIELLNAMAFEDGGDFTQLNLLLSQLCIDENIDENQPLDWVGKKPKSPEKPKKEEKKVEEKKREKKEPRKKRTKEKKEEEDKPPRKHRRRRKSDADSSSGDDSEGSDTDDFEAFLRWKKRRNNRRRRRSNDRGSNDHSDRRRQRPRKKASTEKKKDREPDVVEVDCKDLTKIPCEIKYQLGDKKEVEKKPGNLTPEKHEAVEEKDGKKIKTPEAKNAPVDKDKKIGLKKKNEGTPESNESNNDREDKAKKNAPKLKKDGTPESNESNNDREDKIKKKGIPGPTTKKPDPKKTNEVAPAKKSDDKKK